MLNKFFGSSVKYIALVALFAVALYLLGSRYQHMKIGKIQIIIIGWAFLEAVSFLWTYDSGYIQARLITYMTMALLTLVCSVFPIDRKTSEGAVFFYSAGCAILAVLVLTMGKMDGGVNSAGRITVEVMGSYQDPNGLAASLMTGAFFTLFKSTEKSKITPFSNIIYALLFITISSAIFMTGSRGALVAYTVSLIAYIFIRGNNRTRIACVILIPAVLFFGYFILEAFLPERLFERLFTLEETEGGSRLEHWILAMEQIAKRPFFGNGIAGYFGYFNEKIGHEIAMHNTFVAVLFEVGAVGLSLFLALFLIPFRKALKNRHGMIFAVVLSNMIAAFFLDALHQRYLWNAMMFGLMYYNALSFDPREQDILKAKEQKEYDTRKIKASSKSTT